MKAKILADFQICISVPLKRIFQGFWPQVQNSYFVEHLPMVACGNILLEKQYFEKFWSPQKNICTRLVILFLKYQEMKITWKL